MLLWFNHVVSRQAQTAGMTTGAVTRRTLEHTTDMTRPATRGSMRSSQGKPGCQMVKLAGRVLRLQTCAESDAQKHKHKRRNTGKKPQTVWSHKKTPSARGKITLGAFEPEYSNGACRHDNSIESNLLRWLVRR